ncbi:hypothetical protein [Achromobacter sp.]|uniref:hypothetical protein n=1 Tax=Achromobacter sp. TaxID=134375 RepID=UPI0025855E93|nr:hypothetical protein [Achromobacter sp.]
MSEPVALGVFLRPVGALRFWYCYQLVGVTRGNREDDLDTWHMRRWGLDEQRQPCDDDGGHAIHYLTPMRQVRPGVFRVEDRDWFEPVYFIRVRQGGQMDLF